MLVADSSSAENLESLEGVLERTMSEFLQLGAGQAGGPSEQQVGASQAVVLGGRSSEEPLQLHDTGALEDALARAERKRVDASAKGETEEVAAERCERVQARVAELLAKQGASKVVSVDGGAENMQITPVTSTKRPPPMSVEADKTFLQISRHMDPSVGKETLERAALQVKISDTRVVAAKFVVAETEVRLRSAASAGIRTIVEAMSSHQYNPDVQQAGCKALSDLAVKLRGQKEQETGVLGMRAAVAALRCLTASAPVQEAACVALCHLAPLIDVSTVLEEGSEAVAAVINEYVSNAAVLTHACLAMTSLLAEPGVTHARQRAIQANVIAAVARALKAQPRFGPLHQAAMELLNHVVVEDAERDACWANGVASLATVTIANHPSLPEAVQHACGVLERLCNTPQRAEEVCGLEAIPIVLTAVRMHRSEVGVQTAGAACLKALVVTANGKARAAAAGAMEAVAVAIFGHAEDLKMQEAGARLMKSLAVHEGVRGRPTAMAAIEGLCASVAMHKEHPVIAAEGCGALCNLCIDQPANQLKLVESGAAEAVVAVIREHQFRPEVQEAGIAVLWVIACAHGDEVIAQGGPEVITAAMQRFPGAVSLQTVACAALRAAAEHPGSEEAMLQCGALESVMEALRAHGVNAALQQNGLEAMCSLAKGSDVMKRTALDEGALELCRSAMTLRFSGDEGVTAAGERVLDILEGAVWITAPPSPAARNAAIASSE